MNDKKISNQFFRFLIDYIKSENESIVTGIFYVLMLFIVSFVQLFVYHSYFDEVFKMGNQIKMVLMDLIYKKSLILSNLSRKELTIGQMVNILAVNAQSFVEFPHHFHMCWSSLFTMFVSVFLLWKKLGIGAIAGVLTMVFLLPVNSFLMSQSKKLLIKKLRQQDSRVKIINEILNGIKVLKFKKPNHKTNIILIRLTIDGLDKNHILLIIF